MIRRFRRIGGFLEHSKDMDYLEVDTITKKVHFIWKDGKREQAYKESYYTLGDCLEYVKEGHWEELNVKED